MPRWSQYIQDIPSKIRSLSDVVKGEKWGPKLVSVLEGLSLNSEDINRKIPYSSGAPKPAQSAVSGTRPSPGLALWTLEYMTMHLKPVLQAVTYVKFEHSSNVRKLFGVGYPITLERIMGEIYIESEDDGSQARYYVDLRPMPGQKQSLNAGSLVGFGVGFGQTGPERLHFRLDTTEYRRNSSSPLIANLSSDKHAACKWMSSDALLSEALLADYQNQGLQMYLTLTVFGR